MVPEAVVVVVGEIDALIAHFTEAPQTVAQPATGPTTHAHTREPLSGFRWPCERRTAHGPHDGCPGVAAHPLTMIGGQHRDDRV